MSFRWNSPVTNRRQSDIDSGADIAYLNAKDFNRIEENIAYLSDELKKVRYFFRVEPDWKIDWKIENVPRISDIERICKNITEIMKTYYEPKDFEDPNMANLIYELLSGEKVTVLKMILLQVMEYKGDISAIKNKDLDFEDANYLEGLLLWLKTLFDYGVSCNTHRMLKESGLTHKQLKEFTHKHLRKYPIKIRNEVL